MTRLCIISELRALRSEIGTEMRADAITMSFGPSILLALTSGPED
jgi:hypothetical protein